MNRIEAFRKERAALDEYDYEAISEDFYEEFYSYLIQKLNGDYCVEYGFVEYLSFEKDTSNDRFFDLAIKLKIKLVDELLKNIKQDVLNKVGVSSDLEWLHIYPFCVTAMGDSISMELILLKLWIAKQQSSYSPTAIEKIMTSFHKEMSKKFKNYSA